MDLSLVIVAVDELAPAVDFWRDLTGWPAVEDVPGVNAELHTPTGRRFGLYAEQHFVANLGTAAASSAPGDEPGTDGLGRTEIYLSVDDAPVEVARAVGLGAELLAEVATKPWGDQVGYLRAPGGLVVAIAQPRTPPVE